MAFNDAVSDSVKKGEEIFNHLLTEVNMPVDQNFAYRMNLADYYIENAFDYDTPEESQLIGLEHYSKLIEDERFTQTQKAAAKWALGHHYALGKISASQDNLNASAALFYSAINEFAITPQLRFSYIEKLSNSCKNQAFGPLLSRSLAENLAQKIPEWPQ